MTDVRRQAPKLADLVVVSVVTVLCLLPFVNKSYHVDDPLFLWSAQHIQKQPFNFFGFDVNWRYFAMPMFAETKNPPVSCYYIAAVGWLFGWREITLHLAFLLPAVAATTGAYLVATRLCRRPLLAALISLSTPALVVSSTTIMCDVMMLASWCWAIFFWLRFLDEGHSTSALGSVLLIALATFTKYFAVCLIPLLLVYTVVRHRRLGGWAAWFLIPVALIAGYDGLTHWLYGRGLFLDAMVFAGQGSGGSEASLVVNGFERFLVRGWIGLIFTGGCLITALFYLPLLYRWRTIAIGGLAALALSLPVFTVQFLGRYELAATGADRASIFVHVFCFVLAGMATLAFAIPGGRRFREADSLLLLSWVFGVFAFATWINWTCNARSLLPIAPALGILIARQLGDKEFMTTDTALAPAWRKTLVVLPALLGLFIALPVARGDYQLAGAIRGASERINQQFRQPFRQIYFIAPWGFRWYLSQQGAQPFDARRTVISPADVLILSRDPTSVSIFRATIPAREIIAVEDARIGENRWVHSVADQNRACFYASALGPLPYYLGPSSNGSYSVLKSRRTLQFREPPKPNPSTSSKRAAP